MKRAAWIQTNVEAGRTQLCPFENVGRDMRLSPCHAVRLIGYVYVFGRDPRAGGGACVSG